MPHFHPTLVHAGQSFSMARIAGLLFQQMTLEIELCLYMAMRISSATKRRTGKYLGVQTLTSSMHLMLSSLIRSET